MQFWIDDNIKLFSDINVIPPMILVKISTAVKCKIPSLYVFVMLFLTDLHLQFILCFLIVGLLCCMLHFIC